jgi:hypothetical protein
MLPLRGVSDAPAIARELAELADGEVVLLDLKRESDELYQTYRARSSITRCWAHSQLSCCCS